MKEASITCEDIETYHRFAGDLNGHVRCTAQEARVPDATWRCIDDLRQRLYLAQSAAVAPAFALQLDADLRRHVPDARVLQALRQIVAADLQRAEDTRAAG